MLQADTPNMKRLIANGLHTLEARSVTPSVTLPCHTSIFRGVDVPRHGITTNVFQPLARPVPSLFDVAKRSGMRTGMFFNWGELRDIADAGSFDVSFLDSDCHSAEGDARIAGEAARQLGRDRFDLVFVYLGWTDECGHLHGWMSPEYLEAVSAADRCIGKVLDALPAQAHVILLSDHGGHERTHGTERAEDMTVPFVLHGPGVDHGQIMEPVRIFDTCPTAAALMGLSKAREWEGRAVVVTNL